MSRLLAQYAEHLKGMEYDFFQAYADALEVILTTAQAIAALRPEGSIPQSLVDKVVKMVKAEHGEGAPGTDGAHVRMALEQLKVGDVIKGKAGIGGKKQEGDGRASGMSFGS